MKYVAFWLRNSYRPAKCAEEAISVIRFPLLILILLPTPSFAWNSLGHKVVAEIAWRQLTPEQRTSIADIIRRHPRFDADFAPKMEGDDKATQDEWIFQHAATWPDQIRKNKQYDHPSWHYIDLRFYLDASDHGAFEGKLPVNVSTEYPTHIPISQ
jgi:hypothetical protein